jgi:hypothetical protein
MIEFIVWLAVMTPSYERIISDSLHRIGYTVAAGADNKTLIADNIIIYRISHDNKSVDDVEKDLVNILHSNKMLYHLVVVVLSIPNLQAKSRSSNLSYLKEKPKASKEQEIDDMMIQVNKIISGQIKVKEKE